MAVSIKKIANDGKATPHWRTHAKEIHKFGSVGEDMPNDLVINDILRASELQSWFIGQHLVEMPLVLGR